MKQILLAGILALAIQGSAFAVHNGGHDPLARREANMTRLESKRLEACEKRETKINVLIQKLAGHGGRQIEVFNKIAERTQDFAETKGKKPSNYDALVAEVAAKKLAAEQAIANVAAATVEFKCDGSDPKGVAQGFKEHLKAKNDALKAYKTAVKNLIVGVKSAQGKSSSSKEAK